MVTLFLHFTLHCAKKLFTSHSKSFSFYQLEKIRIKWTHPFSQSLVVMIQHLFFIETTCWISEKEEIHAGHRSGATQSLYRFIFFVASAVMHESHWMLFCFQLVWGRFSYIMTFWVLDYPAGQASSLQSWRSSLILQMKLQQTDSPELKLMIS